MPANGPLQDLPSPLLSEPPDGPSQIAAANLATAERLNMRFASTVARDTAIPNPVDGMEVFIGAGASSTKMVYANGKWRPIAVQATACLLSGGTGNVTVSPGQMDVDPGNIIYNYGMSQSGVGIDIPVDGVYSITGGIRLTSKPNDEFQARITRIGKEYVSIQSGSGRYFNVGATAYCVAGDAVGLQVYNNDSSSLTITTGLGMPYLAVALIARVT